MYQSSDQRDFARGLRKGMTEAESVLWSRLRKRQLLGHRFRRQYAIGDYIVDFECFEARLVIELDGGQHNTTSGRSNDLERTAFINAFGYRVIRFWNHDITDDTDAVLEAIASALRTLLHSPHPGPPPKGEGVHVRSANEIPNSRRNA